jgi:hypothetical protein
MDERLHKGDWLIEAVPIAKARAFIAEHHYARGASNTATHLHGLYRKGTLELCGVAWWLPPTRSAACAWLRELRLERLASVLLRWDAPHVALLYLADLQTFADPNIVLSLSRLAVAPGIPKNAATFLLMRSVRRLSPSWRVLVTYADTWREHTGHIYRVAGWDYRGLTRPERTYTKNGVMVARKAGPRTRTHGEMLGLGAECVGSFAKHRFRLVRKAMRVKGEAGQQSLFEAA